jgi:short-subunit dehydrogenase
MNIIITGASRGIGYETVKKFSASENNTVIAIARSQDRLVKLCEEVNQIHGYCNVVPYRLDLQKTIEHTGELSKEMHRYFKGEKIDILVNSAGLLINKPFEKFTYQEASEMFRVNFFAVAGLIRELIPDLNRGSHVVNIGSMAGFQGSSKFPGLSFYSASKAAIASMTECLAKELEDYGIICNCLSLGAVQTEMLEKAFPGLNAPVSADEMAEYIVNFALHAGKVMNGKNIPVALSTP